jgi:hypothetical protein
MRRKGEKEKRRKGEWRMENVCNPAISASPRLRVSVSPFLLFSFSLLFLVLPLTISAASLAEYRKKIDVAQVLVAGLLYINEEDTSAAKRAASERETLAELRQSLPASEKIEWKGASVETNNKWLQDKLNEYERENAPAQRAAILTEVSERLSSIGQKLDELENPSASNRTKDEDKRKLGEILSREEYQKPQEKQKSFIERILDKIAGWFRREAPTPNVSPSSSGFQSLSLVMQIVLYAVIIGLIGFLIYRFAPFLASRFRRREKREKKDRVILGERIAADETADNLFSEAERLASTGNMRGAIRKGYIALLCELSDRKIIGLSRHKTNRDYLRDVRKKRELYENMNGLTSNFERHWYGFDEAEEKDWEEFRNGYKKAVGSQ